MFILTSLWSNAHTRFVDLMNVAKYSVRHSSGRPGLGATAAYPYKFPPPASVTRCPQGSPGVGSWSSKAREGIGEPLNCELDRTSRRLDATWFATKPPTARPRGGEGRTRNNSSAVS